MGGLLLDFAGLRHFCQQKKIMKQMIVMRSFHFIVSGVNHEGGVPWRAKTHYRFLLRKIAIQQKRHSRKLGNASCDKGAVTYLRPPTTGALSLVSSTGIMMSGSRRNLATRLFLNEGLIEGFGSRFSISFLSCSILFTGSSF